MTTYARYTPALAVMGHWFKRQRAYALGITAAGSSLGGVIYPIMLQHLEAKVGFQWAVRIAAFVTLTCLSVAVLTMKTRIRMKGTVTLSQLVDLHGFRDIRYTLVTVSAFLCVATVRGIAAATDCNIQLFLCVVYAVFLHRGIRQLPGRVSPHHALSCLYYQWLCNSGPHRPGNFGRSFRSVRADSDQFIRVAAYCFFPVALKFSSLRPFFPVALC